MAVNRQKFEEEIKSLQKELNLVELENRKLELEIRIARANKAMAEKKEELKRLKDPSEPCWPTNDCCSCPF